MTDKQIIRADHMSALVRVIKIMTQSGYRVSSNVGTNEYGDFEVEIERERVNLQ